MIWFRPRWPEEESLEPLHLLATPSDEPYEERAACGKSWPKKLNHGSFETQHPASGILLSTKVVCPSCVSISNQPAPPAPGEVPQVFSGWSTPDGKPPRPGF